MSQPKIMYDAQGREIMRTEFGPGRVVSYEYDAGGTLVASAETVENAAPTPDDSQGPGAETEAEPGA